MKEMINTLLNGMDNEINELNDVIDTMSSDAIDHAFEEISNNLSKYKKLTKVKRYTAILKVLNAMKNQYQEIDNDFAVNENQNNIVEHPVVKKSAKNILKKISKEEAIEKINEILKSIDKHLCAEINNTEQRVYVNDKYVLGRMFIFEYGYVDDAGKKDWMFSIYAERGFILKCTVNDKEDGKAVIFELAPHYLNILTQIVHPQTCKEISNILKAIS